jgi:predicted 3-demethylubiquinone-9 3-methyltransferase (glyoxalase superfamily)
VGFYTRVFDAEVIDGPNADEHMSSAIVRIAGQRLHLFNAGPYRGLTEAFSLMVTCRTQEEIDRFWDGLSDGGTPSHCGWITDRFGVTWQIVPEQLQAWLADPEHGGEVTRLMLDMVKIETAPLLAALRR